MAQRHNRSSEVEPGRISPELCLVDPEPAREARACPPVNVELERELERALAPRRLRAPVPGRRRASARPVEPALGFGLAPGEGVRRPGSSLPPLRSSRRSVLRQIPAPGTAVVDTGAPTVMLELGRAEDYVPRGTPDNHAPYEGTTMEIAPLADSRLSDALERVAAAPVLNRCERGQSPPSPTPHGL